MSKIDLRKQQTALLKHERTLEEAKADAAAGRTINRNAILASAAAASAAAIVSAEKLSQPALAKLAEMNDAAASQPVDIMVDSLAHVASVGHLVVMWAADKAGAKYLKAADLAQGGEPKQEPPAAVLEAARGMASFFGIM